MKPNYFELAFIVIAGAFQPISEIVFSSQVSTYYNASIIFTALFYVIYRILKLKRKIISDWGFRLDNFWKCLFPYFIFTAISFVALYGYGWYLGNTPLPTEFWYILLLYPFWGISQQFALQNFVAKNLILLVPSIFFRSLITALLFACAHIPSIHLVVLTFISGFVFTYLYNKYPNLFVLGISHGILGALVFHLVLGQNQWQILAGYFL